MRYANTDINNAKAYLDKVQRSNKEFVALEMGEDQFEIEKNIEIFKSAIQSLYLAIEAEGVQLNEEAYEPVKFEPTDSQLYPDHAVC